MKCPKCGFEQEERLDCRECGIVFSKYNALFQPPQSQHSTEEQATKSVDLQELQLKIRELNSRSIDIEFEKAERKKLRADIKNLEEYILQSQQETEIRIRQMENRLQNSAADSGSKTGPEVLEILKKTEAMEQKTAEITDNLNRSIDQLTMLWERTGQNSFQITELRDQIVALRNEALEMKTRLETMQRNQTTAEPKTIFEDDVKAIRQNLAELGQFISGLGKRQ
jgi:small-conductance mechanosensitive channel